jgi:hypothetical protein
MTQVVVALLALVFLAASLVSDNQTVADAERRQA